MVAMSNRPSESNAISQEVDDLYKEFEEFQTKLKSLVALHNDKHKSLKKLNDQMFGVSTHLCVFEYFETMAVGR